MALKATLVLLPFVLIACDDGPSRRLWQPTRPSAVPVPAPAPTPAPVVRTIALGEEVTGVFSGLGQAFELTAPANGRLVARLMWNIWLNGTVLTLRLGDTEYAPASAFSLPLVATWDVAAGQTYRLTIGPGGTDWTYDDAYVLTTTLE